MNIKSLKLVCFSPTGTTRKIIQGVADGIDLHDKELIDITDPIARSRSLQVSEDELLIVAVPVYMGRVPALISPWLNSIQAGNTPVVCITVYGNRAYENALLELEDLLVSRGCKPIAGAAFIAEHSFSSPEFPSSAGRPDPDDLLQAESFGRKIAEKIRSVSSIDQITGIDMPGSRPYGGVSELWKLDFIEISDLCLQCGICAEGCPAGAIDPENSRLIDIEKCTLCCACIKHCPRKARTIKPGPMKEAQKRCVMFIERKEPEFFLAPFPADPGC